MNELNINDIVAAYMKIREQKDILTRQFELEEQELKESMEILKQQLLAMCNSLHADSIKTEHGTVIRQLKERFYSQDWENFHSFIIENKLPYLLEKRVAQGNMKQYLSENENKIPPGIQVLKEFDISIRKPS